MHKGEKDMQRIRYAIIGTGWRAEFFVRAALRLPELFEVTGVMSRTEERAREFAAQFGLKGFVDLDEMLKTRPDFVISCVKRDTMVRTLTQLLERGVPALAETPLAANIAELHELYAVQRKTGTLLQLAEQYFLWPSHQARRAIIDRGYLGDVHACELSLVHDYHAISLMRFFLGEENGRVGIRARRVKTPVVVTGGRGGIVTDGVMGGEGRTLALFDYADGRLGLYDFAETQYHSAIRHTRLCIRGTRGEIMNDDVLCLTPDNRPVKSSLIRRCDRITGTIKSIEFEGECVYRNPFRSDVALSEDEVAVCDVLLRMGKAVRGAEPFYPDAYAYRDGYMTYLLLGVADADTSVCTETMEWD